MTILAESNEILYINKRLKHFFSGQLNGQEIINKLFEAKNCAEKF
jgi:hypothetical protein